MKNFSLGKTTVGLLVLIFIVFLLLMGEIRKTHVLLDKETLKIEEFSKIQINVNR